MKTIHFAAAILMGQAFIASGCGDSSSESSGPRAASGGSSARSSSSQAGGATSSGTSKPQTNSIGGTSSSSNAASAIGGASSSNLGGAVSNAGGAPATAPNGTQGGSTANASSSSKVTGGSSNAGAASLRAGSSNGGKSGIGGRSAATAIAGKGGVAGGGGATVPTVNGGSVNSAGTAAGGAGAAGMTGNLAKPNFDWVGVVGSGQSLSVGFTPANADLAKPYYNNLMLKLGATSFPGTSSGTGGNPGVPVPGTEDKPWDSSMSDLTAVPLVEPLRAASSGYPRPYPINLWGETHHGAMAREITHFVQTATPGADYVTAHTVVGESGKGITALIKQTGSTIGDTGRAYAATLFEAGALFRLAKAAGKTYGVGVVVMTHGETDADPPNAQYKDQLIQLMTDYNRDIAAITGQSYKIPMYINQQHAYPNGTSSKGKRPDVNNMQWQLGVDHKDDFVCTGPKYQYEANSNGDGVHLSVKGAEMLGEKTAQIYYERAILGNDWQPLMPIGVERTGARVVTVHFHVPVPPLVWDTTFDASSIAITEWKNGKGFELRSDSANLTIASVEISGSDVQITASSDLPTGNLHLGYAITSQGKQLNSHSKAVRWGMLRDSDPFTGVTTGQPNPNFCVSFDLPVPS